MAAPGKKKRALRTAHLRVARTDVLRTWLGLNAVLRTLSEAEVVRLLEAERNGKNRLTFKLRLHSRLNRLRRERERRGLARESGKNVIIIKGD